MQAKVSRECVKRGGKGVWEESFSNTTCCSFQRRWFKVGEEIQSYTAEDGCTQITLVCSDKTGAPDVDVRVLSECATKASPTPSPTSSLTPFPTPSPTSSPASSTTPSPIIDYGDYISRIQIRQCF